MKVKMLWNVLYKTFIYFLCGHLSVRGDYYCSYEEKKYSHCRQCTNLERCNKPANFNGLMGVCSSCITYDQKWQQICNKHAYFNRSTGDCYDQCQPGWMGKGCQYVNLAYNPDKIDNTTDGDIQTGRCGVRFHLNFSGKFIVTALRLHGKDFIQQQIQITGDDYVCYNKQITIPSGSLEMVDIFCDRIGRTNTLTIQFHSSVVIQEIEVYGGRNVALWKTAQESSIYYSDYLASNAVDGSDGNFSTTSKSCTHTDTIKGQPWWDVSLANYYSIMSIRISNRLKHEYRLQGFSLYAAGSDSRYLIYKDVNNSAGKLIWIDASYSPSFPVNEVVVESVRHDESPNDLNILTLCELEIFACRPLQNGSDDCLGFCSENCKQGYNCSNSNFSCPECIDGWMGDQCETRITCNIQNILSSDPHLISRKNVYEYGETIDFHCDRGYILHGTSNTTCRKYGYLNLKHSPKCRDSTKTNTNKRPSSTKVIIAASSTGAVLLFMLFAIMTTRCCRRKCCNDKQYEKATDPKVVLEETDHQYTTLSNPVEPFTHTVDDTEHQYIALCDPDHVQDNETPCASTNESK